MAERMLLLCPNCGQVTRRAIPTCQACGRVWDPAAVLSAPAESPGEDPTGVRLQEPGELFPAPEFRDALAPLESGWRTTGVPEAPPRARRGGIGAMAGLLGMTVIVLSAVAFLSLTYQDAGRPPSAAGDLRRGTPAGQ